MANVYKVKLDIKNIKHAFRPTFIQYDHARFEIELLDGGVPYSLVNTDRVEFTHIRPDNTVIIHPGEIEIIGGIRVITYEYQGTEMDLLGVVKTSFALFDGDEKKVSSHAFDVIITKDLRDEIFNPAEPNYGLVQKLIEDVEYVKGNGSVIRGEKGDMGPQGPRGDKGEPFRYSDFTPNQLESLRGPRGNMGPQGPRGDVGPQGERGAIGPKGDAGERGLQGERGPKGDKGEPFAYSDFTQSQLESLKGSKGDAGPKGDTGAIGPKGDKGDPFRYTDFTSAQLETLRGPQGLQGPKGDKGNPFTYSDFTQSQLESLRGPQGMKGDIGPIGPKGDIGERGLQGERGLKGDKGEPFTYTDFTQVQLEALKGPKGDTGLKGEKGDKGDKGNPFTYSDFTQSQLESLRGPQPPLNNTLTSDSTTEAATAAVVKQVDVKVTSIGHVAGDDLATAIANTPNGGRLILKNAGVYNIRDSITIGKDIVIDGNNAKIVSTGIDRIFLDGNVEIYNTTFERNSIVIRGTDKSVKIVDNKFKNIYDNAIECWTSLKSLIVKDNEIDGTIVSTGVNKNFNNSASFVYLNNGTVDYLRIQDNNIFNIGGGTVIFLGGLYPNFEISHNVIDTMAQRGIGFWGSPLAKGTVSHNHIYRCGVLKTAGTNAGVGCNAIYSAGETYDVEVSDNHIEYVYENGIEGNFKAIKRNTIKDTGMDLVNYPTPSVEGIYFKGNAVIEDNLIINPKLHGMYYYGDEPQNAVIRRNRIVSDEFNENVAICFRVETTSSPDILVKNLIIEDNIIENFDTVLEIPTNRTYENVKIGNNHAYNCPYTFNGFFGIGINCEKLANGVNVLKDSSFDEWVDHETLTKWADSNAEIEKITSSNGVKNTVKVTASDIYGGRITQVVNNGFPSANDNLFFHIKFRARISVGNRIRLRLYGLSGMDTVDNSRVFSSLTPVSESDTDFKVYQARFHYREGFKLEVCNDAITGSWFELSDIYAYVVDLSS